MCLSNELIRPLSSLMSLASLMDGLSPQAIKALEDSRNVWDNARKVDFSHLLFVTQLVAVGVILEGPELVYEISNAIKRLRKNL